MLKGLQVASDKRNTKVVAFLIGSMTLGAAVLLGLEPPTRGWSATTLLMAERVRAIEDVQVQYADPDAVVDPNAYDCVVWPSGECQWQPHGPRICLAVMGSGSQPLPHTQAETLLAVFGSMTQRHGLDLRRVWLHPASDARLHPELPPAAHELCNLLVRKSIVP
jgi:hypothetical protein